MCWLTCPHLSSKHTLLHLLWVDEHGVIQTVLDERRDHDGGVTLLTVRERERGRVGKAAKQILTEILFEGVQTQDYSDNRQQT